jgi:hypothetical protein
VAKLKGARDRVRRERGKCEGRKSYAEKKGGQELVALARLLHRATIRRLRSRLCLSGKSNEQNTGVFPAALVRRGFEPRAGSVAGALPCSTVRMSQNKNSG